MAKKTEQNKTGIILIFNTSKNNIENLTIYEPKPPGSPRPETPSGVKSRRAKAHSVINEIDEIKFPDNSSFKVKIKKSHKFIIKNKKFTAYYINAFESDVISKGEIGDRYFASVIIQEDSGMITKGKK